MGANKMIDGVTVVIIPINNKIMFARMRKTGAEISALATKFSKSSGIFSLDKIQVKTPTEDRRKRTTPILTKTSRKISGR
jgi:hypothetical protein